MNNIEHNHEAEEKEMVKCVNSKGRVIGEVERKEAIEEGILLEAVQIWIINPKNKQVLMQKRALNKINDSGMIDVSASGHVKKNEIPTQAILRESFEEIGVAPIEIYQNLKKLMEIKIDLTKLGRKGKYITHEYISYLDHPIEYYKKQDDEVEKLFFMDYDKVKEYIRNRHPKMRIPYLKQTEELFSLIDNELKNKMKGKNIWKEEK